MKQLLIGALSYIEIKDFAAEAIILEEQINLIKDTYPIEKEFLTESFIKKIGLINFEKLTTGLTHCSVLEIDQVVNDHYETNPSLLVNDYLGLVNAFQIALWFVKDNSVNTGNLYSYKTTRDEVEIINTSTLYSNSAGEYCNTYFSLEELKQAISWLKIIKPHLYTEEFNTNSKEMTNARNHRKNMQYKEFNRIVKSLMLISNARNDSFLPSKISSYMSAVEALIASDRDSLTMQVSERVAVLVGNSRDDKLQIHDSLREAYKARSSFVHGDNLSNNIERRIEEISRETDDIVRRLIIKVITDFPEIAELNPEKLKKWYKEKLLFT
ncbi:HEPN domain-containing protein [Planococcus soli]|uniref:HEPN domain-containing protein n=1 Tax=Planococcus soli TaxID=2666072 RepID=UPI00115F690E|nr:HEPN domain-containing protein [Planococcus soli]